MSELRTMDAIASWLGAGLLLRRVPAAGAVGEHDEPLVAQAISACASELAEVPPPGLIADIAALLAGARVPLAGGAVAAGGPALRAALHAYDDDLLARLVATARWDDAVAAYAHVSPGDRAVAIALVVGAIAKRAGASGATVSPAALRRTLARPRDEREAAGRAALADPDTAARLAGAYRELARGARQSRALVEAHDVFVVDHLAVLRALGGRLTAEHVAEAAAAFARALPRRLPSRRGSRGDRDTYLADESSYPAGGFASITPGGATTGNIENLVASELVYIDEGSRDPIDVFALRYLEGELLHYTRDDSVLRRRRRVIAIALAADLSAARVKDRALPWQRLVLALGLVVAATRWLAAQLGDRALAIRVAFPPGGLDEERALVALLLESEIARGTASVVVEPFADTAAAAAKAADTATADLVVVTTAGQAQRQPLPQPLPRGALVVRADLDTWPAWSEAAEDLLRQLV